MGSKKQNQAIQALEQKMADSPQSRAFSRLAELHRESGNLLKAVSVCVAGVAEHPRYVTGRLVLGRCYKQQGDLPAAFDELTKVCEIDARNHAALRMLADIFMIAGRPEAAGSLYAILCEMEPDNHEMRARAAKNKLRMEGGGSAAEILAQVKALGLAAAPPPKPLPPKAKAGGAQAPTLPLPLPTQAAGAPQAEAGLPQGLVSGDDVVDKLDEMYKGAEPSVQPPVDTSGGLVSGDDVVDKLDEMYKDAEPSVPPAVEASGVDGQISGDDIVDQLDQIYKDAEPSVPPAVDATLDDQPTGDDVADQLSRIYGEEAAAAYAPLAQAATDVPEEGAQDQISGDDIVDQLDQIYKDAEPTPAEPEPSEPEPAVTDQLDELFGGQQTLSTSTEELSALSLTPMEADTSGGVVDQLDELFGGRAEPVLEALPEEAALAPAAEPDFPDITDEIDVIESVGAPAEAEAAPAEGAEGMEDQLSALFGEPEESAIGVGGEEVLIFGDGAEPADDITDALSKVEIEGDITDALPKAELEGDITDALPVAELEGDITDALPKAEFVDDATDALPEELIVDAMEAGLPSAPDAESGEPRMPVVVDEYGEDVAAMPVEAGAGGDDGGMEERLSAIFGEGAEEDDGVKEDLMVESDVGDAASGVPSGATDISTDISTAGVDTDVGTDIVGTDTSDLDAFASAIDAEIEASGAVIDPVIDIAEDDSKLFGLGGDETIQVSKDDAMLGGGDISTMDIGTDISPADISTDTGMVNIGTDIGTAGVDTDVSADIIGTDTSDLDAFASAIDAEIEASGAVIADPVTEIDEGMADIGMDSGIVNIGTDINVTDEGMADISTMDIGTDIGTAGVDTDVGADLIDTGIDLDALASAIDAEIEASGAVIEPTNEISDADAGEGDAGGALQVIDMDAVAGIDPALASDDVLSGAGADDLEARLSELFNEGLYAEGGADSAEGVDIVAAGAAPVADAVDTADAVDAVDAADAEEYGSITAMISKIDVIEEGAAASATPTTPPDADEVQEKLRQLFNAEEEGAPKTLDIGLDAGGGELSVPAGEGEFDTPFDLPDHVLTSTLADIYYQQGQPQLALHIYERLYQRDPSDERLADKIEEIRGVLLEGGEGGGGGEPQRKAELAEKAPRASSGRKKKGAGGAKEELDIRPLAGVRIKKSAPAKKGKRAKKS